MWSELDLGQLQWLFVAGAGVVIGALALALGQRVCNRRIPAVKELAAEEVVSRDPFNFGGRAEKRQAFRRKGQCVEVELTDESAQQSAWRGWVADRSIKGLRLNVDRELPLATKLNVRVCNLNPPMPWMEVKVIHNRLSDQGYEIGCEFVTPPTWNMLLMFG